MELIDTVEGMMPLKVSCEDDKKSSSSKKNWWNFFSVAEEEQSPKNCSVWGWVFNYVLVSVGTVALCVEAQFCRSICVSGVSPHIPSLYSR